MEEPYSPITIYYINLNETYKTMEFIPFFALPSTGYLITELYKTLGSIPVKYVDKNHCYVVPEIAIELNKYYFDETKKSELHLQYIDILNANHKILNSINLHKKTDQTTQLAKNRKRKRIQVQPQPSHKNITESDNELTPKRKKSNESKPRKRKYDQTSPESDDEHYSKWQKIEENHPDEESDPEEEESDSEEEESDLEDEESDSAEEENKRKSKYQIENDSEYKPDHDNYASESQDEDNYASESQDEEDDQMDYEPNFYDLDENMDDDVRKKYRRKAVPKWMKERLFRENQVNGSVKCYMCGTHLYLTHGKRMECGLFVPASRGGKTSYENLRPSCTECNRARGQGRYSGAMTMDEYIKWMLRIK